jgi:tetratricopeptide (TPR) repeat protein
MFLMKVTIMRNLLVAAVLLAGAVLRADILQTRTTVQTGEVVRVEGTTVFIKLEQGEFGVSVRDIVRAEVKKPDAYTAGVAALKAGKAQDAVQALKPIAAKFAGLPAPWALDVMLQLGDAQLQLQDTTAAQATFEAIKKAYPNYPAAAAADVKIASVLFAQKKYDDTLAAVRAYLDPQLKKDFLTPAEEIAVAQALVLMGDCLLLKDKQYEALDCYLKVVTLYDYDDAREGEARFKVGQVLEKTGNWKRARESYEDLLKATPGSSYVDAAKKQIEAINQAHKE